MGYIVKMLEKIPLAPFKKGGFAEIGIHS